MAGYMHRSGRPVCLEDAPLRKHSAGLRRVFKWRERSPPCRSRRRCVIDIALQNQPRPISFSSIHRFISPKTYDLRRQLEDRYQIEIRAFQTDITPETAGLEFWRRAMVYDPDLCCRLRKLEPLKDALRDAMRGSPATGGRDTRASERVTLVSGTINAARQINPLVRGPSSRCGATSRTQPSLQSAARQRLSRSLARTAQQVLLGRSRRAAGGRPRKKAKAGCRSAQPASFIPRSEALLPKDAA